MPNDFAWLESQQPAMVDLLTRLANVNSGSHHQAGLARVAAEIQDAFRGLRPEISERIPVSSATACLRFAKRLGAATRVLLVIHYDTVYGPDHPFQSATRIDEQQLRGPGVADAKGGIVTLLYALLAFEQSNQAGKANLGWEVILNPDEEIGSPGSAAILVEAARRNHYALVFEPAPDAEHLVTARKGSGNFAATFHGRAAHAGREPHKGRNAVLAAARFAIDATAAVSSISPNTTINVARIEGGGPANVVPDLATTHFNVRASTPEEQHQVEARLQELIDRAGQQDGIRAKLDGQFTSPPWVMNSASLELFSRLQDLARQQLHLELRSTMSGGASDANKIASAQIPTLDSMGPVGHSIHSDQETVLLPSLVERAKLAALVLQFLGTR